MSTIFDYGAITNFLYSPYKTVWRTLITSCYKKLIDLCLQTFEWGQERFLLLF